MTAIPNNLAAKLKDEPRNLVRSLLLEHGRHGTAYQIINPGISLWISAQEDAVAGYVDCGAYRVIASAPVCHESRTSEVTLELEADAAQAKKRVCYFGAEAWFKKELTGLPSSHTAVLLGAQPAWSPQNWAAMLQGHASLRAQLNRALNKSVRVEEWSLAKASATPKLHRCLEEWLATRGLPPMHFLVEPETLSCLMDRRIFVALRETTVVGFLVASPVPKRHGWLVEQIVRGRDAVNGTSELLIDGAVTSMAVEGCDYVTLGLAALSRRAGLSFVENPFWLRLAFGWVRAHGNRFYNFEGLDRFKAKFQPLHWEPIYAVTNQSRFPITALYAIASAFSSGSPVTMVAQALNKALRTEARWFSNWLRGSRRLPR